MKYISKAKYEELAAELIKEQRTGGDPAAYVQAIRAEYLEANPRLFELWRKEVDRYQDKNRELISQLVSYNPMTADEAKRIVSGYGQIEYLLSLLQDEPALEAVVPKIPKTNEANYWERYDELTAILGSDRKAWEQLEIEFGDTVGRGRYTTWDSFKNHRSKRNQ